MTPEVPDPGGHRQGLTRRAGTPHPSWHPALPGGQHRKKPRRGHVGLPGEGPGQPSGHSGCVGSSIPGRSWAPGPSTGGGGASCRSCCGGGLGSRPQCKVQLGKAGAQSAFRTQCCPFRPGPFFPAICPHLPQEVLIRGSTAKRKGGLPAWRTASFPPRPEELTPEQLEARPHLLNRIPAPSWADTPAGTHRGALLTRLLHSLKGGTHGTLAQSARSPARRSRGPQIPWDCTGGGGWETKAQG